MLSRSVETISHPQISAVLHSFLRISCGGPGSLLKASKYLSELFPNIHILTKQFGTSSRDSVSATMTHRHLFHSFGKRRTRVKSSILRYLSTAAQVCLTLLYGHSNVLRISLVAGATSHFGIRRITLRATITSSLVSMQLVPREARGLLCSDFVYGKMLKTAKCSSSDGTKLLKLLF